MLVIVWLNLQALKHLRNVQVINFGDCLVRSEGAMAIADALVDGLPILKVDEGNLPDSFTM